MSIMDSEHDQALRRMFETPAQAREREEREAWERKVIASIPPMRRPVEQTLVDDAWERMERDRKAEEAEKASARLLVGALVRAAEKEEQEQQGKTPEESNHV